MLARNPPISFGKTEPPGAERVEYGTIGIREAVEAITIETKITIGVFLLGTMLAAGSVTADPSLLHGPDWYLAPTTLYTFGDEGRGADDGAGIALALGYRPSLTTRFEAEVGGNWLDQTDDSLRQSRLQFSALRFFGSTDLFAPYVRLATGVSHSTQFDTNFVGGLGLGFESSLRFMDSAFRSEIRFSQEYDSNTHDDWSLTAGINVPVGGASYVTRLASADGDFDGVSDLDDNCPGTARRAQVDANGCEFDLDRDGVVDRLDYCAGTERGAAVNSRGCEPDTDRDGVANRLDKCPTTGLGTSVNDFGCARDADLDEDGISDGIDRCPETERETPVDERGCALPERLRLKGVGFQPNSTRLTNESRDELDRLAERLRRYPDIKAVVAGFTDSRGERRLNLRLSQDRAEVVRKYLIERGVSPKSLTAKGYGESEPIADNRSATGRAINRRVELHIRYN